MSKIVRVAIAAAVGAGALGVAVVMSAVTHWLGQFFAGKVLMLIATALICFWFAWNVYKILTPKDHP